MSSSVARFWWPLRFFSDQLMIIDLQICFWCYREGLGIASVAPHYANEHHIFLTFSDGFWYAHIGWLERIYAVGAVLAEVSHIVWGLKFVNCRSRRLDQMTHVLLAANFYISQQNKPHQLCSTLFVDHPCIPGSGVGGIRADILSQGNINDLFYSKSIALFQVHLSRQLVLLDKLKERINRQWDTSLT